MTREAARESGQEQARDALRAAAFARYEEAMARLDRAPLRYASTEARAEHVRRCREARDRDAPPYTRSGGPSPPRMGGSRTPFGKKLLRRFR